MPNSTDVKIETTTNYVSEEDITVVWQQVEIGEHTFYQRTLVGWYYGRPDDKSTQHFSNIPLIAQIF